MRVWAVKGTISPAVVAGTVNPFSSARWTIDLPSGVGSLSDDKAAAETSSALPTPPSAVNSAACRLP